MLKRIYELSEQIASEATGPAPDWSKLADMAELLAALMREAAAAGITPAP